MLAGGAGAAAAGDVLLATLVLREWRTAWLGVLFGTPLANGLRQAELQHFLAEYAPFSADAADEVA